MSQKAMRRLGNQGLLRGWSAWHDQWSEAAKHKRMLAAASSRLLRPKVSAAYTAMRMDWQVRARAPLDRPAAPLAPSAYPLTEGSRALA